MDKVTKYMFYATFICLFAIAIPLLIIGAILYLFNKTAGWTLGLYGGILVFISFLSLIASIVGAIGYSEKRAKKKYGINQEN